MIHVDRISDQEQPAVGVANLRADPVWLAVEPKRERLALIIEGDGRVGKRRDSAAVLNDADAIADDAGNMDRAR